MLAISTATKKAYIGIDFSGKKVYSQIDADCKQSERILEQIDKLLNDNDLSLKNVGNIAIVVGPGSFTGLRIGVALIKGLCAGDNSHKIYPISTLDLMSKIFIKKGIKENFTCIINALSGRVFKADYDKNGDKISKEEMISIEEIDFSKGNICFLQEEFKDKKGGIELDSEILLNYALCLEKEKEGEEARFIQPVYIRKSQAEENIN